MKETNQNLLRTQAGLGLMRSWLNGAEPTPGQKQVASQIAQRTVENQKPKAKKPLR